MRFYFLSGYESNDNLGASHNHSDNGQCAHAGHYAHVKHPGNQDSTRVGCRCIFESPCGPEFECGEYVGSRKRSKNCHGQPSEAFQQL